MRISLRAGSKIYLNGAVVKVDRKVNLELMNDVVFLLESHILQFEDAKTPLQQLYFVIQSLLMEPNSQDTLRPMVFSMLSGLRCAFENNTVLNGLNNVKEAVSDSKYFEALKVLRELYLLEESILGLPDILTTKLENAV